MKEFSDLTFEEIKQILDACMLNGSKYHMHTSSADLLVMKLDNPSSESEEARVAFKRGSTGDVIVECFREKATDGNSVKRVTHELKKRGFKVY